VQKKQVEEKKVDVRVDRQKLSQVYTWGNGLQG
jgi:hypothetical protein